MTEQAPPPAQRLRALYRHGAELRYVSHLDVIRTLERALRRARLPVAYSQGFNAHPRITHAAPLPVGFTSEAEWVDILMREPIEPTEFAARLAVQLPHGLTVIDVSVVPRKAATLPSRLRAARYRVELLADVEEDAIQTSITELMEASQLMRPKRGPGRRHGVYDLRPMLLALMASPKQALHIEMMLTAGAGTTGRPEEVLDALSLGSVPARIARLELIFEDEPVPNPKGLGDL